MRLKQKEIMVIKRFFKEIFKEGDIYLFGSQVDDSKKGGDIDLYISTPNKEDIFLKKIKFAARVSRELNFKKIDVVIDLGENRLIDKIAKQKGIKL